MAEALMGSWFKPPVTGTLPTARFGHTCTFVNGKVLVFGGSGSNDIHTLDVGTMTWAKPRVSGAPPAGRQGHTATLVGKKMFVFGGGSTGTYFKDLHVFDTDINRWSQPNVRGRPPSERIGHTAAAMGTKIFFFGGGAGTNFFNDLYMLDTELMSWHDVNTIGTAPLPRCYHTAVAYGTKILIFGGQAGDHFYNDVHILDTDSLAWEVPRVEGTPPPGRSRHSAEVVNLKMVVFGGSNGKRAVADVHILDTDAMTWKKMPPSSIHPSPRLNHSTVSMGTKVYIFGGHDGSIPLNDTYILDTMPMQWLQPAVSGRGPGARVGHSCNDVTGKLYFLGGASGGKARADVYVFDPEALQWHEPPVDGPSPPSIISHTAAVVGAKILVFGGGDGKKTGGEHLYVLDTSYMRWEAPAVEGNSPGGRVGHTSSVVGEKMYVFGGFGQASGFTGYVNDVYVLDCTTYTWFRPFENGQPPAARLGHTAAVSNKKIYIFGGAAAGRVFGDLHVLDTESMTWTQPQTRGLAPIGRYGHGASVIGNKMFIFGGVSGNRTLQDIHVLDTDTMTWSEPGVTGVPPAPRSRHSVASVGMKFYVFGGSDNNLYYGDLFVLDTSQGIMYTGGERKAAIAKRRLPGGQRKVLAVDASGMEITDVPAWIRQIGFAKHADVFQQHEVDIKTLLQLTDNDLRDMGIRALGARQRILEAISGIKGSNSLLAQEGGPVTSSFETDIPEEELYQGRYKILENVSGTRNVKVALDVKSGKKVSLKYMSDYEEFAREVQLRRLLNPDVITRLLAHYEDLVGKAHCIVYEWGEVTLLDRLRAGTLERNERKFVAERMARVLESLHSRGIVLCDLRPQNITLVKARWKVSELDLCRNVGDPVPLKFHTSYCPPELARAVMSKTADSLRADPSFDVWCYGLLVYELFSGGPLFPDDPDTLVQLANYEVDIPMGPLDDVQAQHLVAYCLERNPEARADVYIILGHAFLAGGYDEEQMMQTFAGVNEAQRNFELSVRDFGNVLMQYLEDRAGYKGKLEFSHVPRQAIVDTLPTTSAARGPVGVGPGAPRGTGLEYDQIHATEGYIDANGEPITADPMYGQGEETYADEGYDDGGYNAQIVPPSGSGYNTVAYAEDPRYGGTGTGTGTGTGAGAGTAGAGAGGTNAPAARNNEPVGLLRKMSSRLFG